MLKSLSVWLVIPFLVAAGWAQPKVLSSPNGAIKISLSDDGGRLAYSVTYRGKPVIAPSGLGLELAGQPVLGTKVRIAQTLTGALDETYSMPHGKSNPVRNVCKTMGLLLEETAPPARHLWLSARAYDDGVAFKYVVPEENGVSELRLVSERTEFRLAKDATTYPLILQGFQTPYEDGYHIMPLSGIHSDWLVGLPLLTELPGVAWLAITEADIDNYSGMYLEHSAHEPALLTSRLAPSLEDQGLAVRVPKSLTTPWRVLMIADQPGRLVESNIVINLNPGASCKIE